MVVAHAFIVFDNRVLYAMADVAGNNEILTKYHMEVKHIILTMIVFGVLMFNSSVDNNIKKGIRRTTRIWQYVVQPPKITMSYFRPE